MVQCLGQEFCAAAMGDIAVDRVGPEEVVLLLARFVHRQVLHNILLAPVYDTDKAEFEWIRPTSEHVECVGAGVHEIELGQYAQSTQAARVDRASELERIRVGQVDVGRRDCQDDTAMCVSDASQRHSTWGGTDALGFET